jgi:hypothetical protein
MRVAGGRAGEPLLASGSGGNEIDLALPSFDAG